MLRVASTFAMWVRALDDRGLMSSARPSRVTTTASWLRGFWSKNSSMKGGNMNLCHELKREGIQDATKTVGNATSMRSAVQRVRA